MAEKYYALIRNDHGTTRVAYLVCENSRLTLLNNPDVRSDDKGQMVNSVIEFKSFDELKKFDKEVLEERLQKVNKFLA